MNKEFAVHMLNDAGKWKSKTIAEAFNELLDKVDFLVIDGRCKALMRTKLEEACFYAKKGMASADFNQEPPVLSELTGWFTSVYPIGISQHDLRTDDVEEAKAKAVAHARKCLTSWLESLDAATAELPPDSREGR